MIAIAARVNPWVVMAMWQSTVWVLVITGVLLLGRHR